MSMCRIINFPGLLSSQEVSKYFIFAVYRSVPTTLHVKLGKQAGVLRTQTSPGP